ncbi:unnamed protein product [Phytophthora fragariaefolia]|uniref:Unnamed protein product n=1 Tax=Phytophthora fragariaefolia TaxID=1490495 RepID=A0A9W6WRW2_9STRA|nr:unnamed protein product [Phytophthora fragariaefolia]
MNYHPAEKEVLALLLLLKTCYTQLAGRTINAYTRYSTLGWINTSTTLFGRSTQFGVMMSPWHLVVHRVNEDDSAFAQSLHSTITYFVGLDKALQPVAPPSKRTPMVQLDPALLHARLSNDHRGFVLSFVGSAKTPKHGGYGSGDVVHSGSDPRVVLTMKTLSTASSLRHTTSRSVVISDEKRPTGL